MPSLAMLHLQPPADEKEFEQMTLDFVSYPYGWSEIYGRRGQKQDGIDIAIRTETGEIIGVQCKNYQKTVINQNSIDQIIELAEKFEPSIVFLIIATTAIKDSNIQKYVYKLSKKRNEMGKFRVALVYWEEISNFIKNHGELLKKYYPNIYMPNSETTYIITTINELKNKFADLMVKYKVHDFIKADPFISIPFDLVSNMDCFIIEMNGVLDRAFVCQTKKSYQYIREFLSLLEYYNANLSCVMQYNYSGSVVIPGYIKSNEIEKEKINDWIWECKNELDNIFCKIYKGHSIYK